MRLVVIGAGSIGGGLGGACFRGGLDVHLVARGAHLAALREGLVWRRPDGDHRLPIPASTLDGVEPRDGDVVAVATKLQDAQAVLDDVRARWGDVPVSMWTNGLIGDRWAEARFGRTIPTVVWVPASVPAPGQAALWGLPTPGVVAVHGGDWLVEALSDGGLPAISAPDIAPLKHEKFVGNLAGAAQALVEDWIPVAEQAIAEGRRVLVAAGLPIGPSLQPPDLSLGTIDGQQRPGGSTRQSLLSGRSLETAFLNGELVRMAREVGVPAPVNERLVSLAEAARAQR